MCKSCEKLLDDEFYISKFSMCGHSIYSLFSYCGLAKRLITEYKLNANIRLSSIIARYFSAFLEGFSTKGVLFVPMPSSKKGLRERGFCQIEEVLFFCRQQSTAELLVLNKKHRASVQKSLNKKERIEQSKDKFCINKKIDSSVFDKIEKIIIVDDVYTTGASIKNAMMTLDEYLHSIGAGIEIEAVVFAKGGSVLEFE